MEPINRVKQEIPVYISLAWLAKIMARSTPNPFNPYDLRIKILKSSNLVPMFNFNMIWRVIRILKTPI